MNDAEKITYYQKVTNLYKQELNELSKKYELLSEDIKEFRVLLDKYKMSNDGLVAENKKLREFYNKWQDKYNSGY